MIVDYLAVAVIAAAHQAPIPADVAVVLFNRDIAQNGGYANCLQINGKDPPKQVVALLQKEGKTIVAGSKCHWVGISSGSYFGPRHQIAYFINIHNAVWSSEAKLKVEVEKLHTSKWGEVYEADMEVKLGKWSLSRIFGGGVV